MSVTHPRSTVVSGPPVDINIPVPPTGNYYGMVYDLTAKQWIKTDAPVVRRNVVPDVSVVWSTAQKSGFIDPGVVSFTPGAAVQVGDVVIVSLATPGTSTKPTASWNTVYTANDFQPASGFYGGNTRIWAYQLLASDFTSGLANAISVTLQQYSHYTMTVAVYRGLTSAPTASSGVGTTGTVTADVVVVPAQTASRAAPKHLVFSAVSISNTIAGGVVNFPVAAEAPLGTYQTQEFIRSGLIQQSTPASPTTNPSSPRIDYVTVAVPLTPITTGGSSLAPANVITDLVDVEFSGMLQGDVPFYDAASERWKNAPADPKSSPMTGQTTIDEFNDRSVANYWTDVDPAGAPSSARTWVEAGDSLGVELTGGDTANSMRAKLTPLSSFGGALSAGDAFVVKQDFISVGFGGPVQGLIFSTAGAASGTQLQFGFYYASGNVPTVARYTYSSFASASINDATAMPKVPLWYRVVMTAANTWRVDLSTDGITWFKGAVTSSFTITPTHVGLGAASWGTAKGHATWDCLRRQAGIS